MSFISGSARHTPHASNPTWLAKDSMAIRGLINFLILVDKIFNIFIMTQNYSKEMEFKTNCYICRRISRMYLLQYMMKNPIILILILLFSYSNLFAQGNEKIAKFQEKHDKAVANTAKIEEIIVAIEEEIDEGSTLSKSSKSEKKTLLKQEKNLTKNYNKSKKAFEKSVKKMEREERDEAKAEFKQQTSEYKAELKTTKASIKETDKNLKKGTNQVVKGKANLKKAKQKLKDAKAKEKETKKSLQEAEKRYSAD